MVEIGSICDKNETTIGPSAQITDSNLLLCTLSKFSGFFFHVLKYFHRSINLFARQSGNYNAVNTKFEYAGQ